MDREFDKETKLREVYKNLCGVTLTVEDMDLPVSVYNYLKRAGINKLEQILLMSENELINMGKIDVPRNCGYIIFKLKELSRQY